jgi:hypothetical protein
VNPRPQSGQASAEAADRGPRVRRSCRRCHAPGPLGLVDGACVSRTACSRRRQERLQALEAGRTRLPAGPLLAVIEERVTAQTSLQGLLGEAGAAAYRRACQGRDGGQNPTFAIRQIDALCDQLRIHPWAVYREAWDAAVDRIATAGRRPALGRAS